MAAWFEMFARACKWCFMCGEDTYFWFPGCIDGKMNQCILKYCGTFSTKRSPDDCSPSMPFPVMVDCGQPSECVSIGHIWYYDSDWMLCLLSSCEKILKDTHMQGPLKWIVHLIPIMFASCFFCSIFPGKPQHGWHCKHSIVLSAQNCFWSDAVDEFVLLDVKWRYKFAICLHIWSCQKTHAS